MGINLFNKKRKAESIVEAAIDGVGLVIDKLVVNDKDRLEAKSKLASVLLESMNRLYDAQRDVLVAEIQGNWLQKSWRPILALSFGFIVIYAHFIAPLFSLNTPVLHDRFWDLLSLMIGGYVAGRTAEKIVSKFTDNVDITFLKKKDRKEVYK